MPLTQNSCGSPECCVTQHQISLIYQAARFPLPADILFSEEVVFSIQ